VNVETEIIAYLREMGFNAYANVPATRPAEFVTVERTGGAADAIALDRPTVAIQAWSASRLSASVLIGNVIAAMKAFSEKPSVAKVSCNAMYNFPDTESGTNRYQAVFDLVVYE